MVFTKRAVTLKESRGQHPQTLTLHSMTVKSLLIIALSIALGVGAVTHAKTHFIESLQKTTEYKELAYRSPYYDGYW